MNKKKRIRILFCGSRDWHDSYTIDCEVISRCRTCTTIISGAARGADYMAARAAMEKGFKLVEFPAQWKKLGRKAGPIRNQQMLDEGKPDFVYAFSSNILASHGTSDMVKRAIKAKIPVILYSGKGWYRVNHLGELGILAEETTIGAPRCVC